MTHADTDSFSFLVSLVSWGFILSLGGAYL
jgi:hypothetical protein